MGINNKARIITLESSIIGLNYDIYIRRKYSIIMNHNPLVNDTTQFSKKKQYIPVV